MSSILVMGGTTFVSSSLAKYLIGQGYSVDILTRGNNKIEYEGIKEHIICDRKSKDEMEKVLKGRQYEFIFDISAYTKEDVEILLNTINKSTLKKYIFCSSGAVYKPSNTLIQEYFDTGENLNWGKYGIDKKEAEDFIVGSGVPYIIFRPTYIYGENSNLYREAYFFDRIIDNKVIPMPYGNNIITQFIHIDDLVKVFESAMKSQSESKIYNVTNSEIVTWEDIVETCGKIIGKEPIVKKIDVNQVKLEPRSYFPFRDVTYVLNIKQLIKDGLYKPQISLKEGLRKSYEWFRMVKPNLSDVRMMKNVNELVKD
ncbi:NAD-dependent epimerase/dehydratase family protein [Clostridium chromiireducens]|uniref:UDP-glucose 4-epimerase n=1 Tax=Clostridium chromiireducens TaxID=225345 RepID=A0A964RKW1_9CLOT|nr:NAD-dependent epimerase/dehydratase family protein [Clostridium chromiireducens]MVX63499.1 NAD-dependent epimerase/dehydratase family protein [Clostridium chromiireducens]